MGLMSWLGAKPKRRKRIPSRIKRESQTGLPLKAKIAGKSHTLYVAGFSEFSVKTDAKYLRVNKDFKGKKFIVKKSYIHPTKDNAEIIRRGGVYTKVYGVYGTKKR